MTATDRVVLIAYDGSRQAKRAVSIVSTFIHEERVILLTAWQAVQMQATRASSMGGLVQPDWDSEKMVEDPGLTDARNFAFEGEKLARENGITHTESYLWNTPPACGMPSPRLLTNLMLILLSLARMAVLDSRNSCTPPWRIAC